jgi:hypothetical protein
MFIHIDINFKIDWKLSILQSRIWMFSSDEKSIPPYLDLTLTEYFFLNSVSGFVFAKIYQQFPILLLLTKSSPFLMN